MTTEETKSGKLHLMPSWLSALGGGAILFLVLSIISLIGTAGYFGYRQEQRELRRDQKMDMWLSYVQVINEQYAVREVIEDKIGDKLSADVKSRMTFEITNACKDGSLPVHYVLAIPEQESRWNPFIQDSPMGAVGLWQIMPRTAMAYYKIHGWTFSIQDLKDPIHNTIIAMDILRDSHQLSVLQGKSNQDDWVYTFWQYSGKGESYAREVLTRSVSYKKFLDTYKPKATDPMPEQPSTENTITTTTTATKVAKKKS
jgi:hypothetical protein